MSTSPSNPLNSSDDVSPEEIATLTCRECCGTFQADIAPIFPGLTPYIPTLCDSCSAKEEQQRRQQEEDLKAEELRDLIDRKWKRIAPPRFHESDPNHPGFKRKLYGAVMKWSPNNDQPWLGIVGDKGCCKTRIALMRTRKAIEDVPSATFLFLPVYEYATAVQTQFSDDGKDVRREARELLAGAKEVDWLVIDDIGKARNTPAVVAALFALLDHRHNYNLATVWTANSTPEVICEGMPADVAGPLVRRLTEASKLLSIGGN